MTLKLPSFSSNFSNNVRLRSIKSSLINLTARTDGTWTLLEKLAKYGQIKTIPCSPLSFRNSLKFA